MPTRSFRIGDGWTATKGTKGVIGMFYVDSGLRSQAEMTEMIGTMRGEMLKKHDITIAYSGRQ